jgi:hypothetical protein
MEKLLTDLDVRRRQNKLSQDRLAARLGIKSASSFNPRKATNGDMYASHFVTIINYLGKPMTDYLIENKSEGYDDANGEE